MAMFGGIDPAKLQAMQQVSKNVTGKILINYPDSTVTLSLSTVDPEAAKIVPGLLEQFGTALATQLGAFFAIQGEIEEKGKPGAKED